jgi:glucose-6-phosphate isomerase
MCLMPYANRLYLLADWFRQLWAESLGKRHDTDGDEVFAGFTPIKALGATDQHSQVQLYREGPNDKVFGFLEVEDFGEPRSVDDPHGARRRRADVPRGQDDGDAAQRREAGDRVRTASRASARTSRSRFPKIDAHASASSSMLWQVATAYAGLMLGIDAYDQPAVETRQAGDLRADGPRRLRSGWTG